jgi:hypothetical protein
VDALKRIATAEVIAEAALFLASKRLPLHHGRSLLADGGMMSGCRVFEHSELFELYSSRNHATNLNGSGDRSSPQQLQL